MSQASCAAIGCNQTTVNAGRSIQHYGMAKNLRSTAVLMHGKPYHNCVSPTLEVATERKLFKISLCIMKALPTLRKFFRKKSMFNMRVNTVYEIGLHFP